MVPLPLHLAQRFCFMSIFCRAVLRQLRPPRLLSYSCHFEVVHNLSAANRICRYHTTGKKFRLVMPAHSRSKNGVAFARLCRGHPRLIPTQTKDVDGRRLDDRLRKTHHLTSITCHGGDRFHGACHRAGTGSPSRERDGVPRLRAGPVGSTRLTGLIAKAAAPSASRTSCRDVRIESDRVPLRSAHLKSRTPPACLLPSGIASAAAGQTSP